MGGIKRFKNFGKVDRLNAAGIIVNADVLRGIFIAEGYRDARRRGDGLIDTCFVRIFQHMFK